MSRRATVEVVVARNGVLGPLHLAIPTAPGRWSAACRRQLAGDRVHTWTAETGGDVWGEVRTCPDCLDLGEQVEDTLQLAILAGWMTADPRLGGAQPPRYPASRPRH